MAKRASDFERMLRVDVHTHVLPNNWPSDLSERYGYGGFISLEKFAPGKARMLIDGKLFRIVEENCLCSEARKRDMDDTSVDVQVLSTVPVLFCYWAQPEHAHELSRIVNDDIAERVKADPTRFVGLGTLPMQDPDRAIQELRRCINELGLAGVEIGSHINKWNLDAPELLPVFQEAERLGACIFVHPWDMPSPDGRFDKYWMKWLVGMPCETTLALCSMIFGGVLEKCPNLRIAFAHGGGSFPGTLGRIRHGFAVRPDLVAINNDKDPIEYLGKIYFDSLVHDRTMLKVLTDMAGTDRVMCGSDYPFPLGEHQPGRLIAEHPEFSDEEKAKLLAKNAFTWLGVDGSRFSEAAATKKSKA